MNRWIERGVGGAVILFLLLFAVVQTVIAIEERSKVSGLQNEIDVWEKQLGAVTRAKEQCRTELIKSNAQLQLVDRWFHLAGGREK